MINYKYKCKLCNHKQKRVNKDFKCWCCNHKNAMLEIEVKDGVA